MDKSQRKFEILLIGGNWITCSKGQPTKPFGVYPESTVIRGWLHYELSDGTIGLARPGTWRVKNSSNKD